MSLYTALTQVLAPYAAKLNGLLTGWDGTKYTTPGEAVRRQVSDLHVMIGDVPGEAIAGSAVSYDGTSSDLSATNVQAAIDETNEKFTAVNGRLDTQSNYVSTLVSPNLMGDNSAMYYPVNLKTGDILTVSTSDLPNYTTNAKISFYDKDKTYLTEYNIYVDSDGKRVITIPDTITAPIKYLRWKSTPVTPMMVNLGSTKFDYVPYKEPIKDVLSKLTNDVSAVTDELYPKNQIWIEKDVLYHIEPSIKVGETFSICVANGENLIRYLDFAWYDENKAKIGSARFYAGYPSSTKTVSGSNVHYISFSDYPSQFIYLKINGEPSDFSPFYYPYKKIAKELAYSANLYKDTVQYPESFINSTKVDTNGYFAKISTTYKSTSPIWLNAGDVLHYNLCGYGEPIISLFDENGQFISNAVIGGSGNTTMTKGEYTLEQDCYVVASHRSTNVINDNETYFYVNNSAFRKAYVSVSETDAEENTFVSGYGELGGWEPHAVAFSQMMEDVEETEGFLYFTDSHFMGMWNMKWKPYIGKIFSYIEKLYYSSPCSFVLHGGDWLGTGEARSDYLYKLSVINGAFRRNFDRYALLVGNHECGNQSAEHTMFTHDTLATTLLANVGRTYYTFDANTFRMYCFDTWQSGALDDFGKEQIAWFADALTKEESKHIVVALHILYDNGSLSRMGEQISLCAKAYNAKGTYEYNGKTYDFHNAVGKIGFIIAGHEHGDATGVINDIPYILTVNTTGYGGEYDFDKLPLPIDLVKVDWINNKLYAYRARRDASTGTIREMTIIN